MMTFSSDCKLLTFGFNIQLQNKWKLHFFYMYMCGGQRATGRNWFSLSTKWI